MECEVFNESRVIIKVKKDTKTGIRKEVKKFVTNHVIKKKFCSK